MSDKMKDGERLNTIVGQGTVLKGECSVNGTVRIDGIIDGTLKATGVAIMGKSGQVKGDLIVGNAIVGGVVEGSVMAEGRLELQSGARVEGDIKAKKLVVEEGVFFQGFCNMEAKKGKNQPAPKFAVDEKRRCKNQKRYESGREESGRGRQRRRQRRDYFPRRADLKR